MRISTFGYRENSEIKEVTAYFVMHGGGLGDYINMVSALIMIAETMPHVKGRIIVNRPFLGVAKYLFDKYKTWYCIDAADKNLKLEDEALIINPEPKKQAVNATGAHLMDLGFKYYMNIDKCPQALAHYNVLPRIDYSGPWKWRKLDRTKPYAVFTPGATTKARTMPAKAFNEMVSYCSGALGVTPVFLGKKDFAEGRNMQTAKDYVAQFSKDYDYSLGVDLREETTLLESVQIMRGARFVLGLDNGLLHFAGCTDTPIIFGHNIAEVAERVIRRPPPNATFNIAVPREALKCIACQSNMRFITGHRFSKCAYDDYKCLEYLFANECETWKIAMRQALGE